VNFGNRISEEKKNSRIIFPEQLFYLPESRTTILASKIQFLKLMGCKNKLDGVQEQIPFVIIMRIGPSCPVPDSRVLHVMCGEPKRVFGLK